MLCDARLAVKNAYTTSTAISSTPDGDPDVRESTSQWGGVKLGLPRNSPRVEVGVRRAPAIFCVFAALASSAVTSTPKAEASPTYSIGLDTTYATTRDGPYGGRADGEVFYARDTLIHSITVWRPIPPDTSHVGMKLWIVRADSTKRPNMADILLSGPILRVPAGDNIHPVEYTWVFDPPFALPARGYFWFGVQPDPCGAYFDLLFNNQNAYKEGDNWRTLRLLPGETCYLVQNPNHFANWDLIFQIEFCDSVESEPGPLRDAPAAFRMWQNGPNPFYSSTTIHFDLPIEASVLLKIFDAQGRLVRTLADTQFPAGFQSVEWDHRAEDGRNVPAGVYLDRIEAGTFRDQKKMVLLAR
jgi:hypothetical protein